MIVRGEAWGGLLLLASGLTTVVGGDDYASAPGPGPWDYSIGTYLWVVWLSLWGASIRYTQAIKRDTRGFKLAVFVIELWAAPACGVIAFLLAEAGGTDRRLMAVSVILAGYAGKLFIERTIGGVAESKQPDGGRT